MSTETTEQTAVYQGWGMEGDIKIPGVFKLPIQNVAKLTARLEKLNRRASKLGMTPISVNILGEANEYPTRWDHPTSKRVPTGEVVRFAYTFIEGTRPIIAGWELAAVLEHLGEAGNILRVVPTFEGALPAQYRDAKPHCDHCNLARARKDTIVVRHQDGTFKQLGRNCLVDFLPGVSIESLATWGEYILQAVQCGVSEEGDGSSGGGGPGYVTPAGFLGYVIAAIRAAGWISGAKAREYGSFSTAGIAIEVMFPPKGKEIRDEFVPTPADFDEAKALVEFAQEHFETTTATLNDYEYNLSVLVKLAMWDVRRHLGLGASLVPYVQRLKGQAAARALQAATSSHVGTVGAREVFTLTLVSHQSWEGQYGVTQFYKFADASGNVVVWKASHLLRNEKDEEVRLNDQVLIHATVKAHDNYKGVKQTIITRGALVTPEQAEEIAQKAAKKAARAAKKPAAQP